MVVNLVDLLSRLTTITSPVGRTLPLLQPSCALPYRKVPPHSRYKQSLRLLNTISWGWSGGKEPLCLKERWYSPNNTPPSTSVFEWIVFRCSVSSQPPYGTGPPVVEVRCAVWWLVFIFLTKRITSATSSVVLGRTSASAKPLVFDASVRYPGVFLDLEPLQSSSMTTLLTISFGETGNAIASLPNKNYW